MRCGWISWRVDWSDWICGGYNKPQRVQQSAPPRRSEPTGGLATYVQRSGTYRSFKVHATTFQEGDVLLLPFAASLGRKPVALLLFNLLGDRRVDRGALQGLRMLMILLRLQTSPGLCELIEASRTPQRGAATGGARQSPLHRSSSSSGPSAGRSLGTH